MGIQMETEISPVISIVMLVYNHEKYLDHALRSIFSQKLEVPFEVVIGEDCSTDQSRDIIDKWKAKYPSIIKPIYRINNVGMDENVNEVLWGCSGKYIAWLEGDDYWIDNNKLNKQYLFLENNEDYIGVTHNVQVVDADEKRTPENQIQYPMQKEGIFSFWNFQKGEWPGQTGSLFHRNIFNIMNGEEKQFFCDCHANGDSRVLGVLLLKGRIKILPEIMSAYRFVTVGGDNWNSLVYGRNYHYIYYQKTRQLERMLSGLSGKKISLSGQRYQAFAGALLKSIRSGRVKDRKIFLQILKNEKNIIGVSIYCFKLAIKHIGKK